MCWFVVEAGKSHPLGKRRQQRACRIYKFATGPGLEAAGRELPVLSDLETCSPADRSGGRGVAGLAKGEPVVCRGWGRRRSIWSGRSGDPEAADRDVRRRDGPMSYSVIDACRRLLAVDPVEGAAGLERLGCRSRDCSCKKEPLVVVSGHSRDGIVRRQ